MSINAARDKRFIIRAIIAIIIPIQVFRTNIIHIGKAITHTRFIRIFRIVNSFILIPYFPTAGVVVTPKVSVADPLGLTAVILI